MCVRYISRRLKCIFYFESRAHRTDAAITYFIFLCFLNVLISAYKLITKMRLTFFKSSGSNHSIAVEPMPKCFTIKPHSTRAIAKESTIKVEWYFSFNVLHPIIKFAIDIFDAVIMTRNSLHRLIGLHYFFHALFSNGVSVNMIATFRCPINR